MFGSDMRLQFVLLAVLTPLAAGKVKFVDKWKKFCGEPDCYTELGLLPNATKVRLASCLSPTGAKFCLHPRPRFAAFIVVYPSNSIP